MCKSITRLIQTSKKFLTRYTLRNPIDADKKSKNMCSSVSLSLCTYICLGTTFLGQAVCICMFRDLCLANQYLPRPKLAHAFCVQVSSSTWSSREGLCFFFKYAAHLLDPTLFYNPDHYSRTGLTPCLSPLIFWNIRFGIYFKLG